MLLDSMTLASIERNVRAIVEITFGAEVGTVTAADASFEVTEIIGIIELTIKTITIRVEVSRELSLILILLRTIIVSILILMRVLLLLLMRIREVLARMIVVLRLLLIVAMRIALLSKFSLSFLRIWV